MVGVIVMIQVIVAINSQRRTTESNEMEYHKLDGFDRTDIVVWKRDWGAMHDPNWNFPIAFTSLFMKIMAALMF